MKRLGKEVLGCFLLFYIRGRYILNSEVTLLESDSPISTQANLLISEQNNDKIFSRQNCRRAGEKNDPFLFNLPPYHGRKEVGHLNLDTRSMQPKRGNNAGKGDQTLQCFLI